MAVGEWGVGVRRARDSPQRHRGHRGSVSVISGASVVSLFSSNSHSPPPPHSHILPAPQTLSEEIAISVGVVKPRGNACTGIGLIEWHAHQREILRVRLGLETKIVEHIVEPRRARRKPAVDAIDWITRHDMTKKDLRRVGMARIEKRIAPGQARTSHAENAPSDDPSPLPNCHHEVGDIRTLEIPPSKVPGVAAHKEVIRRRHSLEEVVKLGTDFAYELQLPAARPALGPPDPQEGLAG